MVRFVDGEPTHVYLSAHSSGYAYTYDAIAKEGKRPKVYVADGTHANYAITGTQEYTFAGSEYNMQDRHAVKLTPYRPHHG